MRDDDPLRRIPPADAVRTRLETARRQVRALRELLRVAERVERANRPDADREGVSDGDR